MSKYDETVSEILLGKYNELEESGLWESRGTSQHHEPPTTQELLLAMAPEIGGGLSWKGAKHKLGDTAFHHTLGAGTIVAHNQETDGVKSYGFVVDHRRIHWVPEDDGGWER